MNQFEITTKELVSPEVSQFFGVVQGKWNRHMEVAALNLIELQIENSTDDDIKELFIANKKFYQNSHEKFSYKSLLDTLSFLNVIGLKLTIQDEELQFVSTDMSENAVLDLIEELLNYISEH